MSAAAPAATPALDTMTLTQLKAEAKRRAFKGYSYYTKAKLIELLKVKEMIDTGAVVNADTIAAAAAPVAVGGRRCGICREAGHNKTSCPKKTGEELTKKEEFKASLTAIEADMGLRDYTDLNDLLKMLGRWAIKNKIYRRKNGSGRDFSRKEILLINKHNIDPAKHRWADGYIFLDNPEENNGEVGGMIRLIDYDHGNPKWSFWMEGDEIKVDWA